jgi:hypothetical protein
MRKEGSPMASKFNGKPKKPKAAKRRKSKGTSRKKLTAAQLGSIAASGSWADIPE